MKKIAIVTFTGSFPLVHYWAKGIPWERGPELADTLSLTFILIVVVFLVSWVFRPDDY